MERRKAPAASTTRIAMIILIQIPQRSSSTGVKESKRNRLRLHSKSHNSHPHTQTTNRPYSIRYSVLLCVRASTKMRPGQECSLIQRHARLERAHKRALHYDTRRALIAFLAHPRVLMGHGCLWKTQKNSPPSPTRRDWHYLPSSERAPLYYQAAWRVPQPPPRRPQQKLMSHLFVGVHFCE